MKGEKKAGTLKKEVNNPFKYNKFILKIPQKLKSTRCFFVILTEILD